jgi:hypothetical protein
VSSVADLEVEDGVFEDVESPSVALVPVASTAYRAPRLAVSRPDASFVTQLIATAEQLPQTRQLRRVAPTDALSAYQAFEHRIKDTRVSTRQVA